MAGEIHPLSELGESHVSGLRLAPDQNRVQIDFGGLAFAAGRTLRFRSRLAGAGFRPGARRPINAASPTTRLAPGAYTFELRAIDSDGMESVDPATLSFVVLPAGVATLVVPDSAGARSGPAGA